MAYLTYPDISYSQFNPRYTGFEIGAAGVEGVVRSCGMRARTSGVRSGAIKGALKNIERRIFLDRRHKRADPQEALGQVKPAAVWIDGAGSAVLVTVPTQSCADTLTGSSRSI